MNKKVLIICIGNSCRSIIAEALINHKCKDIIANSCGVKASGKVHKYAKKVLQKHGVWKDEYHSKTVEDLKEIDYDLVVTVCEHAKETCPVFRACTKKVHMGFDDPDGKDFGEFEKLYLKIENILISKVQDLLG